MSKKHIVVLGAGFAGLHAVRELAKSPEVEVTLIDRNNYHLFQPLLYQVASAGLEAPQITFPVRAYLRKYKNAQFILGNVDKIEPEQNKLWVEGAPISYDYLVIGTGTKTTDFGVKGVAEFSFSMKSLDDSMRIRDRLISAGEEASQTEDVDRRRALMTTVIVGGGPTGVELAGALGEVRRHVIPRDYRRVDIREVRIILVETAPRLLMAFSERNAIYATKFLAGLGVELKFNEAVVEVREDGVLLKSGEFIPSFTTIWSAGVTGQSVDDLETTRGNRYSVTPCLSLKDFPNIYVAGDISSLEHKDGRPHPQVAQVAMQQGTLAGQNILRKIRGEPEVAFVYHDKGNMATMGRNHAIAEIGKIHLRGFPAWSAWLFVHLMNLVGFRNRLMVLTNWAYSYFTYDYAVRVLHTRQRFGKLNKVNEKQLQETR